MKETAFDLIEVRFGNAVETKQIKQRIKEINDIDQLRAVKERIKTAMSISELQTFLDN